MSTTQPVPSGDGIQVAGLSVLGTMREDRGVVTYAARGQDGDRLVVKVAPPERDASPSRRRLDRCAELLADHALPGVNPVVGVEVTADHLTVVSPYVEGLTLQERLADGPLPLDEALAIGQGLLTALSGLHELGLVHTGVKPSNIVLVGEPPRKVVVLDVGLHRSLTVDHSARELAPETAYYASPEHAGLVDHVVDARSDLYSAGVVLYEILAGRPPFTGQTVGEVLRRHLSGQPESLRGLGDGVPRSAEIAIDHLLRKSPQDRYQTARAAAADLAEIASAVSRGERPSVVPGLRDRRQTLTEPAFVGRDGELARLVQSADAARAGDGALVRVEAESGMGKSRLLRELARLSASGTLILRGQAGQQVGQQPFAVLDSLARDLAERAHVQRDLVDGLRSRLAGNIATLTRALPPLADLLGGPAPDTDLGPEEHGEARTIRALSRFLDALGTADQPAVILLDDLQWASDAVITLLDRWSRDDDGQRFTTIVVAHRTETGGEATLRGLGSVHVALGPLQPPDVRRMAESMAGSLPDPVLDVVAARAEGSPFMVTALVHGLAESGAIVPDEAGWRVHQDALTDAGSSAQAAEILTSRLELLPPAIAGLLQAAAVLGKEFSLADAARLAGQPERAALDAIEEARRRHIVWGGPDGDRAAFVHDKLREALLDKLDAPDRRRLHREAAALIESTDPSRVFDLAFHYDRAGDAERAISSALRAGGMARDRYALDIAETLYAVARRCAEVVESDDGTRAQIARNLGEVQMLRGRYATAERELRSALALEPDSLEGAKIEAMLAELAFKRGDLDQSGAMAVQALRRLRMRAPRRGFVLFALWEIIVQAVHTLAPRVRHRRRADGADADRLAMRLYSRLAHVYWFTAGSAPTLWAHLRELNLAERYEPTPELAQAYSEHAPALTLLGWWSRGQSYAERSLAIRTDRGDDWGRGQSLSFLGILLYNAASLDAAATNLAEAERLLEATGDRWELNIARLNRGLALYRLGRFEEAAKEARRVREDGLLIGDPQATGISLEILSKVTGGDISHRDVEAELARATHDVQTRTEVMQAEAVRLLASGRPADAVDMLREAGVIVRRAGIRNEYVGSIRPWLATALRVHLDSMEPFAKGRRRVLRSAAYAALRARVTARTYRCNLPHALRESAIIDSYRSRPRRARRRIEASIRFATELGMEHEVAQSRLALGRLGMAMGWPDADAEVSAGRAAVRDIQVAAPPDSQVPPQAVTLSLADRFDAILEAGRTIATALTPDDIFAAARDAGLALLRGTRAEIVAVPGSGSTEPGFPILLGNHAIDATRPVIASPGGGDELSEAASLARIRSALAAPVFVRGRPVACLYVDHDELPGLFGPDELRLAGFVATLTGAALENAEGFAEVRDLSRSLERRVADRTAQLTETNRALDASLRQLQDALERERDIGRKLRELDELRSDFLSTVSHELRTPLTSIAGFSDTLLNKWDKVTDETRRDFVGRISNNAGHLDQLISELLDFSRLERGQLRIDLRPVEIATAVRDAVEKVGRIMDGHSVTVDVEPGLVGLGDAHALGRVLENLLTNAAKFSKPPTTITVAARRTDDHVTVTVTDQGIGIAAEELPRIFERFYRVHRADIAARGTGIGLAIVKQFVEAQAGRTWVESEIGVGTTFGFTLMAGPTIGEISGP